VLATIAGFVIVSRETCEFLLIQQTDVIRNTFMTVII